MLSQLLLPKPVFLYLIHANNSFFFFFNFREIINKQSIMVAKGRHNATDSPKVEVGEIDTSAPFQSVKDAVTLFGEGAFSGEKPAIRKAKPHSAEVLLILGSFSFFLSLEILC